MSEFIALRVRDVLRIDHRAAVNLPEDLFIELLEKLTQRHANDAVALARRNRDVLILGLEPQHLVDGNQPTVVPAPARTKRNLLSLRAL